MSCIPESGVSNYVLTDSANDVAESKCDEDDASDEDDNESASVTRNACLNCVPISTASAFRSVGRWSLAFDTDSNKCDVPARKFVATDDCDY